MDVCVHSSIHLDLSGPEILYPWMNFKIMWQNCSPYSVELPFESFNQIGER